MEDISRDDVEAALDQIDKEGVPRRRRSTRYCLNARDRHYPPKYVVCLAYGYKTGHTLTPQEIGGGSQSNDILRGLGYDVTKNPCP